MSVGTKVDRVHWTRVAFKGKQARSLKCVPYLCRMVKGSTVVTTTNTYTHTHQPVSVKALDQQHGYRESVLNTTCDTIETMDSLFIIDKPGQHGRVVGCCWIPLE